MTMKKRSWILLMTAALAIQACTGWGQGQRAKIDLPAHAAATAPRRDAPVVIVGAGLCGLTLAHELKKAGIDALLVEATPRIGGRVQTIQFSDGATAEAHMEEYFERSPAVMLLRELGLPLIEDVAHSSVRIDGKIYPYRGDGQRDEYLAGIFDAKERAAFLQWTEKAWKLYTKLHASHYEGKPLPRELQDLMRISFADFVARDRLPRKVSEWIRVTVWSPRWPSSGMRSPRSTGSTKCASSWIRRTDSAKRITTWPAAIRASSRRSPPA
jgi:monoamine oxidase